MRYFQTTCTLHNQKLFMNFILQRRQIVFSFVTYLIAWQTERLFILVQITDQKSETSFELDRNYCSFVNKHFSSKRKISFKQNESIYLKDGIITYKQNSNEYQMFLRTVYLAHLCSHKSSFQFEMLNCSTSQIFPYIANTVQLQVLIRVSNQEITFLSKGHST